MSDPESDTFDTNLNYVTLCHVSGPGRTGVLAIVVAPSKCQNYVSLENRNFLVDHEILSSSKLDQDQPFSIIKCSKEISINHESFHNSHHKIKNHFCTNEISSSQKF